MNVHPIKRALISVSDKHGLIYFAKGLVDNGIELVSTGGTKKSLDEANIPNQSVETITEFATIFDGRVKTLHPKLHGAILGKRDQHQHEAIKQNIHWIDLVIVNFYPFTDALKNHPNMTEEEWVEYIDVGGPTMVRAAAKNFAWVGI